MLVPVLSARRWCWRRCCPRGGGAGAGIDPFATVALKKNSTATLQTGLWQSSVFGAFAIGNLFFVRPAPAPPTLAWRSQSGIPPPSGNHLEPGEEIRNCEISNSYYSDFGAFEMGE